MRTLFRTAFLLGCALPAAAQGLPAPGFGEGVLPVAPPVLPSGPFGITVFGVARTLAHGDVVTFDGLTVRRVAADGTPLLDLGTLPQPVFPGAFAIAPGEAHALVGESLFGELYRVALDGSGMTSIGNLLNNFDAVFEDAVHALVSANQTGSFADNHIVRVDLLTGAQTDVCFVTGPSGPVARDPLGNLYYGLQKGDQSAVISWTASQLASGLLLGEADATVVSTGWNGIGALAFEPATGLYVAENHPVSGAGALYRAAGTKAASALVVETAAPFTYLGGLELDASSCGGVFAPFQPLCGGTLRYSAVDFVSVAYRAEVNPARPEGMFSGGGTVGPGEVTFTAIGGPPSGVAQLFFGLSSLETLPETAYLFPGALPLFTGLPLSAIELVGPPIPFDAAGSAALTAYHPGGLLGQLLVQAVCITTTGAIVGTSTAAHL